MISNIYIPDTSFAWPQGIKARRVWPRLLRDFRWRSDAAVQIQCHVRGHLTRVRLGKIYSIKSSLLWRKPLFNNLRAQAAHIIQKYFRFVAFVFICISSYYWPLTLIAQ